MIGEILQWLVLAWVTYSLGRLGSWSERASDWMRARDQ